MDVIILNVLALQRELASWDGKDTALLAALYQKLQNHDDLASALIDLLGQVDCQKAAGWLLRQHLKHDVILDETESDDLMRSLKLVQDNTARLNLLQSLDHVVIEDRNVDRLIWFLDDCMQSGHTFIKAWSYHGYYCLACQHPGYRDQVTQMLEMGLTDEPASVRARIRHCLKAGYADA